jgi:hypothetical protein
VTGARRVEQGSPQPGRGPPVFAPAKTASPHPPRPSPAPQARHKKLGGPRPALRVVSYHADTTNRAPTFDIDMDDLYETDPATGG